jgi:hypothetical protein
MSNMPGQVSLDRMKAVLDRDLLGHAPLDRDAGVSIGVLQHGTETPAVFALDLHRDGTPPLA